jgi:uncharacterized protein (TIGR02594 family)
MDGIVGPQTWTALGQKFSVAPNQDLHPKTPSTSGASWMEKAKTELGVHEYAGTGSNNQRIIEYLYTTTLHSKQDETPWCAAFVNWVMTKSGHRGTNNAAAISWLKWGTHLSTPRYGAVAVIYNPNHESGSSGNHVGFWVSETSTHFRLLGGNQSNKVKYSDYPKKGWQIKGYRWP